MTSLVRKAAAAGLLAALSHLAFAESITLEVTITNNAPTGGVVLTPVWVGFHNGSFDSYDSGSAAASALESLAELGMTGPISDVFAGTLIGDPVDGRVQGAVANGAPLMPGESASAQFVTDSSNNRYFSYASMVLPSSDYFIANGNPMAHDLADLFNGNSTSISFNVLGANDAGTEINDFATAPGGGLVGITTASDPTAGAEEGGVVTNVVGDPFASFLNLEPGGFDLSILNFNNNALYTDGLATVTISTVAPVPVPAALPLTLSALGVLFGVVRRRSSVTS